MRRLERHAYLLLCLALLPLVAWRVLSATWLGDFWEHVAVVAELAQRPLDPNHPMLAIHGPHALTSPYHLALALVAKALGAAPMAVLAAGAIANWIFLAVGFRLFVRLFTRDPIAPVIALLFTLLLWGFEPWVWSGFYDLASFSVVMPYPSTFATAATFIALWAIRAHLLVPRARWPVVVGSLAWVVGLTHPPTLVFLLLGAAALLLRYRRPMARRSALWMVGALGAGTVATLLWPYYPVGDLPGADPAGYLRDNDSLLALSGAFSRTWPALLGLPFLVHRALRRWSDPLVAIFVGASAVYLAARFGQLGSLATTIRFVVLSLHVAAAAGLAGLVARVHRGARARGAVLVVAAAAALAILAVATPQGRVVAGFGPETAPNLSMLATEVPDDAVVMTDPITALEVPAWGPKVVAWHYAMPFVEDRERRRADVDRFFATRTSADARRVILDRWCAPWLLLVPERLEPGSLAQPAGLAGLGREVVRGPDGRSILVRVDNSEASCPAP